uniref:RNA-directed DNA polymerase, eukaryota, reverse transcriptase zinc-binding domain protein n=1 Tax=Tanacetum cinerariifolium TaxID=118510 RepID=A0A699GKR5_TANCI|nr:RNA-directed DNA polymerase, eukaryota, reverse transcriptase zinc-binding domain protein [Tanacetum cinerariifolium]
MNSWFARLKHWNAQFEIPDRVIWIDVEGTPLQAWSHANFNSIVSKQGELIYMDESNASNKYSLLLYVKTKVHHLIAKSFKVILEGKVLVVRAKEVNEWVPDFKEDNIAQSDDGSDNDSNPPDHVENSLRKMKNSSNHMENFNVHMEKSHEQLENSPDHVENSHVHAVNSTKQMDNSPNHVKNSFAHVENSYVHLENSPCLSGDHFSLEKLIWNETVENVAHEGISSIGTIKSIPKNMSPGGSKHDHIDSLAPSPKPINGLIVHRHISDHRLIIPKESHMDYGSTLFRLFYSWFLQQDLASVVEDSWNNDGVQASNAMILLKNKLKSLRKTLKM